MPATDRRHRGKATGTHPDAFPGGGFLHARFVIRFDLPGELPGPFYATRHPDPPHDWAMTHATNSPGRSRSTPTPTPSTSSISTTGAAPGAPCRHKATMAGS